MNSEDDGEVGRGVQKVVVVVVVHIPQNTQKMEIN